MKQILLSLLLLCSLGIIAQDVVVRHQKKQQTTATTKPKQNSSQKKRSASAAKSKQNEQNVLVSDPTGNSNGHGYVDLGLPSGTKWATCNVGATTPYSYGYYYAWGETSPQSGNRYIWGTYKFVNGVVRSGNYDYHIFTKYDDKDIYGVNDNKKTLESIDDAATQNWGGTWQMPTVNQIEELTNTNYTTLTRISIKGIRGFKFTSKINGNSIFLPASGFYSNDSKNSEQDTGYYWTRVIGKSVPKDAETLVLAESGVFVWPRERCIGASVRAVLK